MSRTRETQDFENMRSRVTYVDGQRRVYNHDFSWRKLIKWPLRTLVIVVGIAMAFAVLNSIMTPDEHRVWEKKVAANAIMSSLSEEDRAILAEGLKWRLDKSNLITVSDEPRATVQEEWQIFMRIYFHPATLIIMTILVMCVTLLGYYEMIDDKYFLADFPEVWPGKWLLPLLTCAGFPFYVISYLRMRCWREWVRECEAEKRSEAEAQNTTTAEEAAGAAAISEEQDEVTVEDEVQVDEPFSYEDLATSLVFTESQEAKTQFAEFYEPFRRFSLQRQLEACQQQIETVTKRRNLHCEKAEAARAELRTLEIQRIALEGVDDESGLWPEDLADIATEWQEIMRMRGVTSVEVVPDADFKPTVTEYNGIEVDVDIECAVLQILVKVRIPIGDDIYDRGDWMIKIGNNCGFDCVCVRTGRRDGDVDEESLYVFDSGTFCFGQRSEAIRSYLRNGQILAAVSLMVDSLHAIDEGDQETLEEEYKRVVAVSHTE